MSMIHVSASDMQSAITKLETDNQDFLGRVQELNKLEQQLMASYTGDSATAFNTTYQASSSDWNEFYKLMEQYIANLKKILNKYIATEEANKNTARS